MIFPIHYQLFISLILVKSNWKLSKFSKTCTLQYRLFSFVHFKYCLFSFILCWSPSYIKYTINYCSFLYLTRMKIITDHYCPVPIISIILNKTGIFFNRTGWDLPEARFQIPSCSQVQDGKRQKINLRLAWEFFVRRTLFLHWPLTQLFPVSFV